MSLDTRVETLEHEFKILKNEIESTLLEIQNQVLIHYYPSLRAEESTPPKDLLAFVETQKRDDAQRKASPEGPLLRDPGFPQPKTKEVTLTEMQEKAKPEPLTLHDDPPRAKVKLTLAKQPATPWPAVALDQAAFPYIAKWVNDSVEKIGKELTQNMVASSASAEHAGSEITETLLQFITLCEEEEPPEQVDTNAIMEVLLKLNKLLDQVAKLVEPSAPVKEEEIG